MAFVHTEMRYCTPPCRHAYHILTCFNILPTLLSLHIFIFTKGDKTGVIRPVQIGGVVGHIPIRFPLFVYGNYLCMVDNGCVHLCAHMFIVTHVWDLILFSKRPSGSSVYTVWYN